MNVQLVFEIKCNNEKQQISYDQSQNLAKDNDFQVGKINTKLKLL